MKDQSSTFLRNLTSLTTANFFARVVGAVATVILINHLGDERYGFFKAAMSFATIVLTFAETGVGMRFLFDRSGDKSAIAEHFAAALLLQVLPYAAFSVVATVVAYFVYPQARVVALIVPIVSFAAVLRIVAETSEKVLNVYQEMHLTAMLRAGRFAFIAAGAIFVAAADLGPVAWALVTLAAMVASAIATLAVALRFVKPVFRMSTLWPTFKVSYIFGLGALFYAIYDQADQFMLSIMGAPGERFAVVGMYGAAYVLISFTFTIPTSFVASMEPVAFAARGQWERLSKLAHLSYRAVGALALPLGVGTFLFASEIHRLVLPKLGGGAVTAISILAIFATMRFLNFPGGMLMAACGMQRRRVKIQAVAVVINIAANLILIPRYGLAGAAWATVGSEIFILLCYDLSISAKLPGFGGLLLLAKPLVATALMGLLILATKYFAAELFASGFMWLAVVPVAAGLYFAALAGIGFFGADEKAAIARFTGRLAFWKARR